MRSGTDTAAPEAASETVATETKVVGELSESAPQPSVTASQEVYTVAYTADGFSPKELTVKAGDRVVWVNAATTDMWPATAAHPTHTVYPGSDIAKCSEADTSMIFDACHPFGAGDAYAFTFTEIGSWKYHNHLNVQQGGIITVTE